MPDPNANGAEDYADLLKMSAAGCQRFIGSDGYLVCDRCGSMWSPLLHGLGWLPLSCPDRKKAELTR
jgi:hypothetical protein